MQQKPCGKEAAFSKIKTFLVGGIQSDDHMTEAFHKTGNHGKSPSYMTVTGLEPRTT